MSGNGSARIEQLEEELRLVRRFSAGAIHDLKAPVRAIVHLCAFIEEDLGEEAAKPVAGHLAMLKKRAHRLELLVKDLLTYSLEGIRDDRQEPVGTRDLVQEIWTDIDPPDRIELMMPGTMPVLVADRQAMRQVLGNLLENAVKYHRPDGGCVIVQSSDQGDRYRLSVIDDGPGIDERTQKKVFEPLVRGTSEGEGSGLGLALVAHIVRAQGCELWVESDLDEGSSFHFTWPKPADATIAS